MSAGTRIVEWLLSLETVSESADRAVRVTVSGQHPPAVELAGVVGRYSAGALGSTLAAVATDAFTRHHAATVDLLASVDLVPDPDATDTPGARRRALMADLMADARAVADSPGGLVTIELTGDRRVGAWVTAGATGLVGMTDARLAGQASAALTGARADLIRQFQAVHREARQQVAAATTRAR